MLTAEQRPVSSKIFPWLLSLETNSEPQQPPLLPAALGVYLWDKYCSQPTSLPKSAPSHPPAAFSKLPPAAQLRCPSEKATERHCKERCLPFSPFRHSRARALPGEAAWLLSSPAVAMSSPRQRGGMERGSTPWKQSWIQPTVHQRADALLEESAQIAQ